MKGKGDLVKLISNNKIELAIKAINDILEKNPDKDISLLINLLHTNFNELKTETALGTIGKEEVRIRKNKITIKLLEIVGDLEDKNYDITKKSNEAFFAQFNLNAKKIRLGCSIAFFMPLVIYISTHIFLNNQQQQNIVFQVSTSYGAIIDSAFWNLKKVIIGENSSLICKSLNDDKFINTINVTGDVLLEIEKQNNGNLEINTPKFQVKVLGTTLHIKDYQLDTTSSIIVLDGKILTNWSNKKMEHLQIKDSLINKTIHRGQKLIINSGQLSQSVKVINYPGVNYVSNQFFPSSIEQTIQNHLSSKEFSITNFLIQKELTKILDSIELDTSKYLKIKTLQGIYYSQIGQLDRAFFSYHDLTAKIRPENSWELFFNLGNHFYDKNEMEQVILCDKEALKVASKNQKTFIYFHIGYSYKLLGDFQKAIEYIELSLDDNMELDKLESARYFELAESYKGLNKYKQALKFFSKAKDEYLKHEENRVALDTIKQRIRFLTNYSEK